MRRKLHIIRDHIFFDSVIRIFESIEPGLHEYYILSSRKELKYVKSKKVKFIRPAVLYYFFFVLKLRFDSVIIHGLNSKFLGHFLINKCRNIKVLWIGWGFDYYDLIENDLLKEKTRKMVGSEQYTFDLKVESRFLRFINIPIDKKKLLKTIDYFAPVLESEYNLIKEKSFYEDLPLFLDWNYLTLEDDLIKGFENLTIQGNNILVGNNANPFNNHLDAFLDIQEFPFSFENVICPLSYGDKSKNDFIISEGNKVFKDRFYPITDFLKYEDYIKNIISCKFVFINSIKQNALGNIVVMLYLGAYIILDERNPVYVFFKKLGIQIYSIEDAKLGLFDDINLMRTRLVLKDIWGRDSIQVKSKVLIQTLNN